MVPGRANAKEVRTAMLIMQHTSLVTAATTGIGLGKIAQCLIAVSLGLFIIGIIGFSQIDIVHNAAHDTRHANAFPCH